MKTIHGKPTLRTSVIDRRVMMARHRFCGEHDPTKPE